MDSQKLSPEDAIEELLALRAELQPTIEKFIHRTRELTSIISELPEDYNYPPKDQGDMTFLLVNLISLTSVIDFEPDSDDTGFMVSFEPELYFSVQTNTLTDLT